MSSAGASSISLMLGLGLGIALRLLAGRLMSQPPKAAILWSVELALSFALGAITGVPLAGNPAVFASLGGGLGVGLTGYAVTSGVIAVRAAGAGRPIALILGLAHFVAVSVAACAGLLLVVGIVERG